MSVQIGGMEHQVTSGPLVSQKVKPSTDFDAHYKWPVVLPHPGGHTEPETEHEKELLDDLHFRLRFAKDSAKQSQNKLPMLREIEFLLQNGRFYSPRPLPKDLKPGKRHGCYSASQLHAANAAEVTYVEGYGLLSIVHPHAWCIDAEGQVIDRTWTGQKGRPIGQAYFGVPLDRTYVAELLLVRGFGDAFLMPAAFVG